MYWPKSAKYNSTIWEFRVVRVFNEEPLAPVVMGGGGIVLGPSRILEGVLLHGKNMVIDNNEGFLYSRKVDNRYSTINWRCRFYSGIIKCKSNLRQDGYNFTATAIIRPHCHTCLLYVYHPSVKSIEVQK